MDLDFLDKYDFDGASWKVLYNKLRMHTKSLGLRDIDIEYLRSILPFDSLEHLTLHDMELDSVDTFPDQLETLSW